MARNTELFMELLKPHYNNALRYCMALAANSKSAEANDILQESLLKGLEKFDTLRDESKFRSWFFKIITREFYTSIRKHFWIKFLPMDSPGGKLDMPNVFDAALESENRNLILKALSGLSPKERSALLLFEVAEFSIEEITELQEEKSISAVKSRLSRTREKLRKYISSLEQKNGTPLKNLQVNCDRIEGDLTNETLGLIAEAKRSR